MVRLNLYDENSNEIFGKSDGYTTHTLSLGKGGEFGMSEWRHIRDAIKSGEFTEYYDPIAKAAWCRNSNGITMSYDNEQTIKDKVDYVVKNNLGGFLIWEISDDTRDGQNNLLNALNNRLKYYNENDSTLPIEDSVNDNGDFELKIVNNTDIDLVIKPGTSISLKLDYMSL